MMKLTLRISSLFFGLVLCCATGYAQPANDNCSGALEVAFSDSEATVVKTNGDSRGATASTTPSTVCSSAFYTDDVFFKFTTPATLPGGMVVIRTFFGDGPTSDVTAVGMALYKSCGTNEVPIVCFSSTVPEDDRFELAAKCMLTNQTYILRVWSTGSTPATEGTFRVGVYLKENTNEIIRWEDRFDSNPFTRGWTTYGACALQPDSSMNAVFKYYPDGTIPASAFTPITTILSESGCDGAVGVHSDFNDNAGTGVAATGPVPTSTSPDGSSDDPATYVLESPAIYIGDWNAFGLSVAFDQAVRELRCVFTVSFRNRNAGDPNWTTWTDVEFNQELVANASGLNNTVRRFLPGANVGDSLQIKLTYLAHYYYWIVDDFKILDTECNNTRVGGETGSAPFIGIAPWAAIPANQTFPYPVVADIYNAGACVQTNVKLNHTVTSMEGNVLYDEDLNYGDIDPDSLAQNKNFPILVDVGHMPTTLNGVYTLFQDSTDFDPSDNSASYMAYVGGNTFALESGRTRGITPSSGPPNYESADTPTSYVYGNYFHPVEDAEVEYIEWGVDNATEMEGYTVNVILFQWTDLNADQVSSSNERRIVGLTPYTFTGQEGDNVILQTVLENFDNPGDPILMQGGFPYLAMIEWQALLSADPQFFLSASDARNYDGVNLAFDQAFTEGQVDRRFYASCLGLSPDGNVAEIDYNLNTETFGFDLVPLVRVVVELKTSTIDQLPVDNLVTVYPNPANEKFQVKLDFIESFTGVNIRLIDNLGRVVYRRELQQAIAQHEESINVNDLPTGNYMLHVTTPAGQRTVPVAVIK